MAQTDLVAQKLLGTDPQVGFGEASVLPYRQRQLDNSGFEALERTQTRRQAAEAEKAKSNEEYIASTIKNLPVYRKELDSVFGTRRDSLLSNLYKRKEQGTLDRPDVKQDILRYYQDVANANQLFDQYEKLQNKPLSKYTNKETYLRKASDNLNDTINDFKKTGDFSIISNAKIEPDALDPEHFLFDAYYYDKYHNRPDTSTAEDRISYTPEGQRIIGNKVTAKFTTKDKDGRVIPGIDRSIINDELYSETTDPHTLEARKAIYSLVDKKIMLKAQQLRASDPRYQNMDLTSIIQSISTNPRDDNFREFNRNKIAEDLVKSKIEVHQAVSTDKNIGQLQKTDENNNNSEYGSNENFYVAPTVISRNTGEVKAGKKGGYPLNAPGVSISSKDKPIILNVAPKEIHDLAQAKRFENTDQVNIKATALGYALRRRSDGHLISFKSIDDMYNYINTASKKDLDKLDMTQMVFGTIEEKKTVEGDTGEDSGSKRELTVNRSVAIPYEPEGETGSQLNGISGGKFSNRKLTEDEQRINSAWNNRTVLLSDKDLIDEINNEYPGASKEQKLEIFKKVRASQQQ
jgi:hypothetical protein